MVIGNPPGFEAWLERRRALGQDTYDEVWEGEYHVAPMAHGRQGVLQVQLAVILAPLALAAGLVGSGPLNIGEPADYRVADGAYLVPGPTALWNPTAAIVVEITSPDDETAAKLGFYHRCGVGELLVLDPSARTVAWYEREATGFVPAPGSRLLGVESAVLAARIDWPEEG